MSRTIAQNAQDYVKLTPSLFHINKRNKSTIERGVFVVTKKAPNKNR